MIASVAFADRLVVEHMSACPACFGELDKTESRLVCRKCGETVNVRDGRLIYDEPPADAESAPRSRSSEDWTRWRRENYRFYEAELKSVPDTARIIDLGAGPSQFLDLFERFDMYVGVDFVPYEAVSIVTDFSRQIPLKDACADVVILSNVLEHMQDPLHLLKECVRLLKPQGVLLATTPFLMRIHQAPYDFNRYTVYQHRWLLEQTGLTDIRVTSIGSPALPLDTLERQFFVLLTGARPFKNAIANVAFRIVAFLCKILARGVTKISWGIYMTLPPNERFTDGYGSFARKKP